jgi:hypothetical protein
MNTAQTDLTATQAGNVVSAARLAHQNPGHRKVHRLNERDSRTIEAMDERAPERTAAINAPGADVVPLRGARSHTAGKPTTVERQAASRVPDKLWREVLGEEIRRQRHQRSERLSDTADRAGISPQYLSELERGLKDPSSEMLEAVAGALGGSSFELTRSAVRTWGASGQATTTLLAA